MKTQVIATLANYAYSQGKRVLLVAPGKKAMDELVKRCFNVFGLKVPSDDKRINTVITSGFMNRLDYKDPVRRVALEQDFATYDWVMSDETEYSINDAGEFIYSHCTGATNFYGFSGTASKKDGAMISFVNGLDDVVLNNKDLIKFFGPNLVYRMPLKLDIDMIRVLTPALNHIEFDAMDFDEDSNVYMKVMNRIFTTPDVVENIVKIEKKYPKLYIPINNLNTIITYWIENYFKGVFRILLICGEGYIYYDIDGNRTKLKDLQEAWNYVNSGKVDIIPSTSAGFRALDLPDLENILLIANLIAGAVLQSVGRTARGNKMNILWLEPEKVSKKIPIYSKGVKSRTDMIKGYYKYCSITEKTINIEDL